MRSRPKKNRALRMEKVSSLFAEADENGFLKINGGKELFLEIGCGKGAFAAGLSEKYPQAEIVALEKIADIIMMAAEKAQSAGCENIKFFRCDAEKIDEIIPENSVDRIFLNFSDPWRKKRNAKRRLTAPAFLQKYKKILKTGAVIYFKTDNNDLFDYSLETFSAEGFILRNITADLHNGGQAETNIVTEYEKSFSEKGFKIFYLEAVNPTP